MDHLTRDTIDLAALMDRVSDPVRGGTAVFLGTVRRSSEDGPVVAIEYSAHEAMAEAECARIVTEAAGGWPDTRVAVQHRLGRIPTGEASVAVVAASAHRAEAFEACRFVIEEVKRRVPVWKQEFFADGTLAWRENDALGRAGT